MRWEGESDFTGGSSRNLPVEIKKKLPVRLRSGFQFGTRCLDPGEPLPEDACQSAASSAVPESPVASVARFAKAFFRRRPMQGSTESTFRLRRPGSRRPSAGPDYYPMYRITSTLQEQKDSRAISVNAQADRAGGEDARPSRFKMSSAIPLPFLICGLSLFLRGNL